ncbi:DNA topoisomerase 2-binding protein 1 [Operophtera brumata]|uniref:DNA topoisomerase 2-binding protein 1 n=1 Tax=Operophtera brumata TaxID=104452 RepID=A0A0L7L0L2_OPEBR|nr:DNA topoisomerase 2-binding protein 1 [Operophtera brumata]
MGRHDPQVTESESVQIKRFMLSSNVDVSITYNLHTRTSVGVVYLGGSVSETAEVDPAATHLLCAAPGRSEKMLGSVAAGRIPGWCVSETAEVDPAATHLLCAAPGRSEKMLGPVQAGRWVPHPAYVARSRANGNFLPVTS